MKYVLIWAVFTANNVGGVSGTTSSAEFDSKITCEQAVIGVKKGGNGSKWTIFAECYPK